MAGKDKGLTGTVSSVLRDKNAVIVQGYNLVRTQSSFRGATW